MIFIILQNHENTCVVPKQHFAVLCLALTHVTNDNM